MRRTALPTALATVLFLTPAGAAEWMLDGDASHLAFGSIKNGTTGEVHSFRTLSGGVDAAGAARIEIDLTSVDTLIEIRDERMIENVFQDTAAATITADVDIAALEAMAPGEMQTRPVEATLSFLGTDVPLEADMLLLRLTEARALVATSDMVFVSTGELGIEDGIDALQSIAGLDGITRAVPVTLRLVFERQ